MSNKSGMHRFLSRREKKQPQPHHKAERKPDHFGGIFTIPDDPRRSADKEHEKQVKAILDRLRLNGINTMVESNADYALQVSHGDGEAAYKLLVLLQSTYEGIVERYDPETKLLGAVNRESVTCYADALLFAMFAMLDSFEAMVYETFDDLPRKKLAGLLRLWVNMLRTGRMITVDVTALLQSALAERGWEEAEQLRQQDPSEAFTFITGQLGLPLLTLKMDLYHTGKKDPTDDHKFVNERLLEVAIPDEPEEGSDVITLEQCLEHYFNNRIEVKRHLERRRRDTLKSVESAESAIKTEKEPGMHVEVVELSSPTTPVVQTPAAESPFQTKHPLDKLRPTAGRKRADSIFSQRRVELTGIDPEALSAADATTPADAPMRKMSTRTEVLMPAWQFFKLLPWYTDHLPNSDAQVAAHFSRKRPVLGICLKRYSCTNEGQARRKDTYVDIPLEIGVPDFVSDDQMTEEGPLVGNFRLQLQSVVCHRGVSVHSGHYVALCRGTAANATNNSSPTHSRCGSTDSETMADPWMRFDDLARDRVSQVDIHEALRKETPYLLFYQVIPIGDDGHSIHDLPSYAEATTSRSHSDADTLEKPYLDMTASGSDHALANSLSKISPEDDTTDAADFALSSQRVSLDATRTLDGVQGRASADDRRPSIVFSDSSVTGSTSGGSLRTEPLSAPPTPSEEKSSAFLNVANKIGSRRVSKNGSVRSRATTPGSEGSANRLSFSMAKLTQRMSRNEIPVFEPSKEVAAELSNETAASQQNSAVTSAVPSTNASKESITTANTKGTESTLTTLKPPPKPAVKKERSSHRAEKEKRKSRSHHEDRDCVVM